MLILFLFTAGIVLLLVGLTFAFCSLMVRPQRYKLVDPSLPFVSVIIPARNEEANIAECVKSFQGQDYPSFEIIVVDDRSSDATGEIVQRLAGQDARIRYLSKTEPPPPGWTGKCSALKVAADLAKGDWFFFADADTRHRPGCLRTAVTCALAARAHMLSFWPLHELGSFGERLIMPVLWSSFFWSDPFHLVNNLASNMAYSIGHSILIDRRAYFMVGGHQSVREWIIEDHALAKMVKNAGLHVLMADGRDLFKVRMYTDFQSVWFGWTKMLFSLAEYRWWKLFLILFFITSVLIVPFVEATAVCVLFLSGVSAPDLTSLAGLAALQLGLVLAWFLRVAPHYRGLSWWCFPALPVGAVIVLAAYLYSAYLVVTGAQVRWRGRSYTVTRLKLPQ